MKLNVGGMDRILRIVVGLVLIAPAATGTVGWWGWLGVVPLLTGDSPWLFEPKAWSKVGAPECSIFLITGFFDPEE